MSAVGVVVIIVLALVAVVVDEDVWFSCSQDSTQE